MASVTVLTSWATDDSAGFTANVPRVVKDHPGIGWQDVTGQSPFNAKPGYTVGEVTGTDEQVEAVVDDQNVVVIHDG